MGSYGQTREFRATRQTLVVAVPCTDRALKRCGSFNDPTTERNECGVRSAPDPLPRAGRPRKRVLAFALSRGLRAPGRYNVE